MTKTLARLLSPYAPHLAEELWQRLGGEGFVCQQPWPRFDPALVAEEQVTYAVQVMSRMRADVSVPRTATEAEVRALAEANERVKSALSGKSVKRVIFVRGRLLNFVVE